MDNVETRKGSASIRARPRHLRSIDAFFAAFELVSGQLTLGREAWSQQSAEGDLAYLLNYLFRRQTAVGVVPAREPQDRAEQAECRHRHVHLSQLPFLLELIERVADQIDVGAFPLADLATMLGNQPGDLLHYDRDRVVALRRDMAGDQPHMVGDDRAQPGFGVGYGARRNDHVFIQFVHAEVHDAEEQVSLPLDVMIDARLSKPDGFGDVVHGRGVVALFANEQGRRAVNLPQTIRFVQGGQLEW